jgi:hypothetical protein
MSSELQSIRALLLQQAQYGGPGWQSPRAPAQNKRPQRPGHQRSFLPRSLLADLSWVDDPDVQGAIQDLSLQFAAEPRRPQPIAEGKDNPVRSSSQVVGFTCKLQALPCSAMALMLPLVIADCC